MHSCRRLRGLAAALTFCLSAAAQTLDPGEAGYLPVVDEHRFALARDRILSVRDPRLLQVGDGATATFEFHLTRSWSDSASPSLAYCIAYVGGRARPAPVPSAASEPSDDDESGDPYEEPTTVDAGVVAAPAVALDRFWPQLGLYINDSYLFAHSGDRLVRCELTQAVREALRRRERIYFVASIRSGRMLVHANGSLCAQFKDLALQSMAGVAPVPDHDVDQLALGTKPALPTGRVRLEQEVDGEMAVQSAAYDLDACLRNFDGKLGGVRYWSRAFPESYVSSTLVPPRLAQRGYHDVRRNISFPTTNDANEPSYVDLVFASDFSESDERRHRLRQQFPVSGEWVNGGIEERIGDAPPGLDDAFGNVVDRPLITIVPTASRHHWFVYEDADLHGVLQLAPGATKGTFRQSLTGEGDAIAVRLARDELRFELPKSGRLFGGNDGGDTRIVTLRRPHLEWLGDTVDRDNPFWNGQQVAYINVPFRAFDITRMDPLYAFQGRTGCARRIFDEPARHEYRLDSHKIVVPSALHLCPVDRSSGSSKSTIVQSEREYVESFASHKGEHVDTLIWAQDENTSERWQKITGGSAKTFVGITRSVVKKFALVLNRSQARLHPGFVEACHELADKLRTAPAGDTSACSDFIEKWGTHFAMGSVFGGMMVQERRVAESQVRDGWSSGKGNEEARAAGMRDGLALGPYQFGAGKNEIGERSGWGRENGNTTSTLRSEEQANFWAIPGDQLSPGEPTAFSVTEPVPLFYDLRPLHELLTPANFDDPFYYHDVRMALRQAIRTYVERAGEKVPPGQSMQPWLADLGKVQPRVRFVSAYTDSHIEGMLNLHTFPQNKGNVRVDIAPSRKDELVHQIYALIHNNGRGRERNAFAIQGDAGRFVEGAVADRRALLADGNKGSPLFRTVFEGSMWIPAGGDFSPPRPQPYRVRATTWPGPPGKINGEQVTELLDQMDERKRKEALAQFFVRDLPAPGKKATIARAIPLTPKERMPSYRHGNALRNLPTVFVNVTCELELAIVKEPIQPPDLGAKDLARYRNHVASQAAGQIAADPAALCSLSVGEGEQRRALQVRRLPDRSELVRAYEAALQPAAAARSPVAAALAERLLARLRHAGLPSAAFLLEADGRPLQATAASVDDVAADRLAVTLDGAAGLPVPFLLDDGRLVLALDAAEVRLELAPGPEGFAFGRAGDGFSIAPPTGIAAGVPR